MRSTFVAVLWSMALAGIQPAPASAQERFATLDEFFVRAIGLQPAQRAQISHGEVVTKILPTRDERDVTVFAAVTVAATRAFFVERQSDLPRALTSPTRIQAHLFSTPAVAADVQDLTLSDGDLKELSECKPGNCNFKLPASEMERAQTGINPSDARSLARAQSYVRQRVLSFITDYRQRGNAALFTYDDGGGVKSSDALVAMLRDSSLVFRAVPALGRSLIDYPRDSLVGATHVSFWSEDQLPHVRKVIRITDQTMYTPPEYPAVTIIAAKQLYANHYFEAGLETLAAVELPATNTDASGQPGVMLIAVRQYRFDHLPSGGLLNLRGRVINGLSDGAAADLTRLKRETESAWRAKRAP